MRPNRSVEEQTRRLWRSSLVHIMDASSGVARDAAMCCYDEVGMIWRGGVSVNRQPLSLPSVQYIPLATRRLEPFMIVAQITRSHWFARGFGMEGNCLTSPWNALWSPFIQQQAHLTMNAAEWSRMQPRDQL
nr:hypothetical protein CFP56_12989 [Quercus suber]